MFRIKILLLLSALFLFTGSFAQPVTKDSRTLQTKIADLLAQMPTADLVNLDKLMLEVAGFGEEGLAELAGMLAAPGKGNDVAVRFTIGSFTNFANRKGQESYRMSTSNAFCKALDKASDKDIKAFLITQLQFTGKDEAVPCIEKYLTDKWLCDPSTRALVTIGSPDAKTALLNALPNSEGAQLNSIVKALGDCKNEKALIPLNSLVTSPDNNLKKTVLYAISNIGDPQSEKLLYEEAKNSGFTYDPVRATDAYLRWIEYLIENGNNKLAEKHCSTVIKECVNEKQVQTRCKALALLTKIQGEKALPLLLAAVESGNTEYRNAALQFSLDLPGEKVSTAFVNKASKLGAKEKADVISMLGKRGDKSALTMVIQSMNDKSKEVRLSAIEASQKLGDEKALQPILDLMRNGDTVEINAARKAILSMKGNTVISVISRQILQMPSNSKVALLDVIAAKRAADQIDIIKKETLDKDENVRLSAFQALKSVVTESDLPDLFSYLETVNNPEEIKAVQSAIVEASGNSTEKDMNASKLISKMRTTQGELRSRYFGILSEIGGTESLKAVSGEFNTGNEGIKKEAFNALVNWNDSNAAGALWKICTGNNNQSYFAPALKAYIKSVAASESPEDQKLLLLRNAMEIARSGEQKRFILSEVGKLKTLTALIFLGKYISDPEIQQDAAKAAMKIALADKSLYGEAVTALLNEVLDVLSGQESQYQKEALRKHLSQLPVDAGFVPLFNGKDLSGWKGLVADPVSRTKMDPGKFAAEQIKADEIMRSGWSVKDGILIFNGQGNNLCTAKKHGDFEMVVDWKITPKGDGGIYLRGSPQVQIWDVSPGSPVADIGSGGLFNNKVNPDKPLKCVDNPTGEWNTFRIKMLGERVTVYLNGILVVDNTILENYWDRTLPIFPFESIELQAHGSWLGFRDIYIRELPRQEPWDVSAQERAEGFRPLFDGLSLNNWTGNTKDYVAENGNIVIYPSEGGQGGGGNLYTKEEFTDFIFRFEFLLTPGANNGLGIRAPLEGEGANAGGMELQILDNDAEIYRNIKDYQYHGSVYGVIPAKPGYLKPVGEWNYQEVIVKGTRVTINLNGTAILDGDLVEAAKNGTMDGQNHPEIKNPKGHIAFLGHGSVVKFRNIRIKDLSGSR